ncbi:MAG: hypothetical protein OXH92_19040 [Bryobacterales bacterium]|nr:hypothetical protein [Bryobacterales bacterium]
MGHSPSFPERATIVLLTLCTLAVAGVSILSAQVAYPSAVFTLDVERGRFFSGTTTPLDVQFDKWARRCRIAAGGALYVLTCPPVEASLRSFHGDRAPESVDVSLALFRDLDEAVYLAGCLSIEELKKIEQGSQEESDHRHRRKRNSGKRQEEKKAAEATQRDCRDVAPGQTFSMEVEEDELRILIRGRQLPFTVFGYHPKDKPIGAHDEPPITKSAPRIGPVPRVDKNGIPRTEPPLWHLPPTRAIARSTRLTGQDEPLRTGRFVVSCAVPTPVYVDGAYMGICPLDMPLIAGPHTMTTKRRGGADRVRGFRMEAGKTVEFRVAPAR